jgi:MoaA/NifB/PqqE/SkfB family radical SAM enzyme
MTAQGRAKAASRKVRELALVARALASTGHPVMAQIVPARFCNLSCAYCNEYDKVSAPVALDKVGAMAGMITNGYLLNVERIERLNKAGLDHMQISIDNINPDDVSMKSLKVLDKKLEMLAQHAEFHVNINSVVGGGIQNPNDALVISKRALELGFSNTIGIIHDGDGQLKPLKPEEAKIYFEVRNLERRNYSRFNQFQEAIAQGKPNDWRCRAGSRYLYICEDGLVHYCSQQRGFPGVPIAEYTTADVKREFLTAKACSPNCTVSCVHQISYIDHWRAPQTSMIAPGGHAGAEAPGLVTIQGAN